MVLNSLFVQKRIIKNAIRFERGCAIHTPFSPNHEGSMKIMGIRKRASLISNRVMEVNPLPSPINMLIHTRLGPIRRSMDTNILRAGTAISINRASSVKSVRIEWAKISKRIKDAMQKMVVHLTATFTVSISLS